MTEHGHGNDLMADAVLADMDGTLVDSTAVVEGLWAEFADRFHVPLDEVLHYSHGRQTSDTVSRFLPDRDDVDAIVSGLEARELGMVDGIVEVPGARSFLDSIAGAPLAVVTSAPRALAERRLSAAGLGDLENIVAAEDVSAGKPDPAGYVEAARRLGVAIRRCVVLEDADAGIRSGLASGARVIVIGSRISPAAIGLTRVTDLRQIRAHVEIDGRIALSWPGQQRLR